MPSPFAVALPTPPKKKHPSRRVRVASRFGPTSHPADRLRRQGCCRITLPESTKRPVDPPLGRRRRPIHSERQRVLLRCDAVLAILRREPTVATETESRRRSTAAPDSSSVIVHRPE